MKLIASKILYYCGDLVSRFLYFDRLAFLYPLYSRIMILSSELDKEAKIWYHVNNE
jgi:hypothetical protein